MSERRRPVPMASSATVPHAAARSTLGSGRHTTTKASVRAPPRSAAPRSVMPNRGAMPRRSASRAVPGGPMSRTSTMVRLLPDTASRCVRSLASKASCRSGVIREVSPTTSPGSSARASGASPSVASRSPARSPPAVRWTAVGGPVIRGGPSPCAFSTAANRSPSPDGGASRPVTLSRVEGSNRRHCPPVPSALRRAPDATITRTGVWISVDPLRGAVTRVTSASSTRNPPAARSPRMRGRIIRGSDVTVNSAVT